MNTNLAKLDNDGRFIWYEGKDPKAFVEEIKERFGFDPSADPGWCWKCRNYCFQCPAEYLDEIYYGNYPTGS